MPSICHLCNQSFPYAVQLQQYMRKEYKAHKPLTCYDPGCNFKTQDSVNLTEHLRTHNPESKLKCPHCDYRTAWQGNLNRHRMNQHPVLQPVFLNPAVLSARGGMNRPGFFGEF